MSRFGKITTTFALIISLGMTRAEAFQDIITIPVETPVHGQYISAGNVAGVTGINSHQLFLTDTFTGNTSHLIEDDNLVYGPVWDSTGVRVSYLNSLTVSIFDVPTNNILNFASLQDSVSTPVDWSDDGRQLLLIGYHEGRYELRLLDTNTESSTLLLGYNSDQIINDLPFPPLPSGVSTLKLWDIKQAAWNPVYPEWVVVQFTAYTDDPAGEGAIFPITLVYNLQTSEKLSLDSLFSYQVSVSPISWSPDGRYLVLQTTETGGVARIIAFDDSTGNWSLTPVKNASTEFQMVLGWFGAGDLLLTGAIEDVTGDDVEYIAQIIDGVWHYQEFIRFPKSSFEKIGTSDWHITASEAEKQQLSCLFDDTLPARLMMGGSGQVTFTGGTPSRLRAEPGTHSAVVASLRVGTAFQVVGGAWCVDGYRWWQLKVDDQTTGWAAEADPTAYFLEPVAP